MSHARTLNGSWLQRLAEIQQLESQATVALGLDPDATLWNKFGYHDNLQNGVLETIWEPEGLFVPMSTAGPLSIVSDSIEDTNTTGTGSWGVVVYGINENYENVTEVVLLNGLTPVLTTNNFLGVNRVANYLVGSSQYNVGTITLTGDGTTQATIPATQGTSQQAFLFVPANATFLASWLWINALKLAGGSSPKLTVFVYITSLVSNSRYEVFRGKIDTSVDDVIQLSPPLPFVIGEKSLFEVQAVSDTNGTACGVRFSGIEYR